MSKKCADTQTNTHTQTDTHTHTQDDYCNPPPTLGLIMIIMNAH